MSELKSDASSNFEASAPNISQSSIPPRPPVSAETKRIALAVLKKTEPNNQSTVALQICSLLAPHDALREELLLQVHSNIAADQKNYGPFAYHKLLNFYFDEGTTKPELHSEYLTCVDSALTEPRRNTPTLLEAPEGADDKQALIYRMSNEISKRHNDHHERLCTSYEIVKSEPLREELLKRIEDFSKQHPANNLSDAIDRDIRLIKHIYRDNDEARSLLVSNIIHNAACLDSMKEHAEKLDALITGLTYKSQSSYHNGFTAPIGEEIFLSFGKTWEQKVNSDPDLEDSFISSLISLGKTMALPELLSDNLFRFRPSPAPSNVCKFVGHTLNDERVLELVENDSCTTQLTQFQTILESFDLTNETIKKNVLKRVITIFES